MITQSTDTGRSTDAATSPFSYRLAPKNDIAPFTASTRALLGRFAELELHTHYGDHWRHPKPGMTIGFGAGSGWLWGTITITDVGRVSHMKARWLDQNGTEQLEVADGVAATRALLERQATQRLTRLTWLAQRNGLTVTATDGAPSLPAELVAELRGCMDDGYTQETINSVFGKISDTCDIDVVCVWEHTDSGGTGGNAQFYIDRRDNGPLRELSGDLQRWLLTNPGHADAPQHPGSPATWFGPRTDIDLDELAWHDGFHNYAIHDYH